MFAVPKVPTILGSRVASSARCARPIDVKATRLIKPVEGTGAHARYFASKQKLNPVAPARGKPKFVWSTEKAIGLAVLTGATTYLIFNYGRQGSQVSTQSTVRDLETIPVYGSAKDMQAVWNDLTSIIRYKVLLSLILIFDCNIGHNRNSKGAWGGIYQQWRWGFIAPWILWVVNNECRTTAYSCRISQIYRRCVTGC